MSSKFCGKPKLPKWRRLCAFSQDTQRASLCASVQDAEGEVKGPSAQGRLVTLKCLLHAWTCTDPALGLMMDNWSQGGCSDNILRFMDVTVTMNSGSNSAYVCLWDKAHAQFCICFWSVPLKKKKKNADCKHSLEPGRGRNSSQSNAPQLC